MRASGGHVSIEVFGIDVGLGMLVVVEGIVAAAVDLALVGDIFRSIYNTLESCAKQLTTSPCLRMARRAFLFTMSELSYNCLSFFL